MKNTENIELNSSLKNYNFKGWTSDKIIEKYEYVLASREKQIEDLSLEFGNVYQNLNKYTDLASNLENENNQLKNKNIKLENILQQELNNKEIMFIRLENKERECDELRAELSRLTQHLHQNKTPHVKIDNEQTNKTNFESKEELENQDKKQGVNNIAEKISELKVDQGEEKTSKTPEINSEIKERNINTKSLNKIRELKEKKSKIQGNAANVIRSNSISVDPSSSNLIETTIKSDNLNSDTSETLNTNTKNEEANPSEEAK